MDFPALLRAAGLRVTRPRLAVLTMLTGAPHSSAEQVIAETRRTLGSVSTQAVYNVLNALTACGILRRIQPAGSVAVYELRPSDNHHHVVCRSCGRMDDVACGSTGRDCIDPAEVARAAPGFVVEEAEVTLWGRCTSCAADAHATVTDGRDDAR